MSKRALLQSLSFILLSITLLGCTQQPTGSKKNPLKLMFIPYVDQQTIMLHTEGLVRYLEKSISQKLYGKDEGFYIKASIPTYYISVVEGFGHGQVDLSSMTTFSYLLTKDIKKYPVEAILTVVREGDGKFYKGALIARADSNVKSVEDINGKKFAFSDPASTSGFILPSKLFKDKNIKPAETVFAGRHDNVISMVYQGQVDAGAIFYSSRKTYIENGKKVTELRDARGMTKTSYPDVEEKIKIIGFTEESPNEPWVIRKDIFADPAEQAKLKKAITDSIVEYTSSPEGKELMRILVRGESVVPINDSHYDSVRKLMTELNLDIASLVK